MFRADFSSEMTSQKNDFKTSILGNITSWLVYNLRVSSDEKTLHVCVLTTTKMTGQLLVLDRSFPHAKGENDG